MNLTEEECQDWRMTGSQTVIGYCRQLNALPLTQSKAAFTSAWDPEATLVCELSRLKAGKNKSLPKRQKKKQTAQGGETKGKYMGKHPSMATNE